MSCLGLHYSVRSWTIFPGLGLPGGRRVSELEAIKLIFEINHSMELSTRTRGTTKTLILCVCSVQPYYILSSGIIILSSLSYYYYRTVIPGPLQQCLLLVREGPTGVFIA